MYTSVFILRSSAVLKGISDEIPLSTFKSPTFLHHISPIVEKTEVLGGYVNYWSICVCVCVGVRSQTQLFSLKPALSGKLVEGRLARNCGQNKLQNV